MSLPRVIVTAFGPGHADRLEAWRAHVSRVLGDQQVGAAAESPGGAVWHLASVNNRMLARRGAVFGSAAEAVDDARASLRAQAGYDAVLVRDRRMLALGWYLRSTSGPVIVSARWYSTDRDRRKSLDAAVDALRIAVVEPATRTATTVVRSRGRLR